MLASTPTTLNGWFQMRDGRPVGSVLPSGNSFA